MNPLRDFQEALLKRRVVAGFLAKTAMEHATPEAMKQYLHDHPDADKSKHHVKKDKGGGGSSGGDTSADSSKAESRSKETGKLHDEMKSLKSKVDNADPSAKKKFDRAYDKLHENGEAAAKSAEKLLKKFEGAEGEAGHAVELLSSAVRGWESNKMDHAKAKGGMAHKKLQQAEQTWAYATKIDDQIKMLSKALKGE